ncbi:hypothetical protein DBR43_15080 [Pedobacter sp. KBW06]|uniref:hypothetical protein n=1 Tax=Pedobacter sp. KBW06 TaxID=2153359 RepID=UPI000F59DD20|nr:hypothetical protein [Pedobacter sp. KBW06]RQO69406.1 hypothetical protein DBR43_15080 [Pedobacter sp. KBW06]
MRKIDLVTDFQKKSIAQIRQAFFRERTASGELVFELEFWSVCFDKILYLYPDYRELPKESVIYKYCWSNEHDDDVWGNEDDGEVEFDRVEEFYGHLKSITLPEDSYGKEEYHAILEICESAIKNKNKLFFMADY